PDIAEAVDGRTSHPAEESIRGISPLLMQGQSATAVNHELVPPPAAATCGRFDEMNPKDRLRAADASINEARHDLVALRVEPAIGAGLRYAVFELTAAEIVVRRDGNPLRSS